MTREHDPRPSGLITLERRSFLGITGGALALIPIIGCKGDDSSKDETKGGASTDKTNAGESQPPNNRDKGADEANDVELLNKGILLEQGAINVYKAAAVLPFIAENKDVLPVAALFMSQHEQHRDTLAKYVQTLGGQAVDPVNAKTPAIPAEVLDETLDPGARTIAVLKFARSLEKAAADAYFQLIVQQLQTEIARRLAAEILPVEAQHVAVYDLVLKAEKPVNAALFTDQS